MKEKNILPLFALPLGEKARVRELELDGNLRRRFLDLGLIYDTEVVPLLKSPAGDPIAYEIRGTVIALRSEEASRIWVEVAGGA